jgi:hypothetical protein
MKTIQKTLCVAGGTALVLMLGACGSSSSSTPTTMPTPVPTPPPPVVIQQGGGALPFDALAMVPFTTTASGTLNVTVDWTLPTNSILVILVRGACSFDQLLASQCTSISATQGTTPKPRKISLSGQAAGLYTLFIGNLGPGDESSSYQVVLNPGGGASATTREPTSLDTTVLRRFGKHVTLR